MPTISDTQALGILRDANNKSFDAQANAQVAGVKSQLGAKVAGLKATQAQVDGDKFSSITKAGAAGMGTLLNSKLNMKAQTMAADATKSTNAAGLNAATQGGSIGNVVTSAADAADQNFGGAAKSSQAKVDQKVAETQDTMATMQLDTAKAGKEKASKAQDSVEDFAKGMFERAKQVIDKLF